MTFATATSLAPAEVVERARRFFADRVPHHAAYPEAVGPTWIVLRGQGGEEIAIGCRETGPGRTHVRASTLLFDQAVERFLTTLPAAADEPVADAPAVDGAAA